MKYFDIHTHINFKDYDEDREEVMKRVKDLEMGIFIVGSDLLSSERAVELTKEYENTWAVIGIHPTDDTNIFDEEKMRELISKTPLAPLDKGGNRIVAIGECGLDYFRGLENKEEQKELFKKQIDLASEFEKPLMLHIRASQNSMNAYEDVLEILKSYKKIPHIHLHFFAGDKNITERFLEIGASFSFTGVITFTDAYNEIIKMIPIENIMSETDCPFVSPEPYRGKRNEPAFVIEVIKRLAEIKKIEVEEISKILRENVRRVFGV